VKNRLFLVGILVAGITLLMPGVVLAGPTESLDRTGRVFGPLNEMVGPRLPGSFLAGRQKNSWAGESGWKDISLLGESGETPEAKIQVPVLMYHYIRVNPDPKDKVGFDLSVTPDKFEEQMIWLRDNRYETLSLDEFYRGVLKGETLPERPVVITLDDGYADSYWHAYPILRRLGLKAANFIITGFIGAPKYLSLWQMREMAESGVFSFGAHTVSHLILTPLSEGEVREEIRKSKVMLEQRLGARIDWFAYPYGRINAKVAKIVQEAGYFGAFGTNDGASETSKNVFTLPRIRVSGGESLKTFAAKLESVSVKEE